MSSWKSYPLRTAHDVPWSQEREQRVLGGALRSFQGRTRRTRALELSAAVIVIVVLGRVLWREPSRDNASELRTPAAVEAPSDHAATNRVTHSTPANHASAKRTKGIPAGGFAGTGGHGGGGNDGGGGSAGTS